MDPQGCISFSEVWLHVHEVGELCENNKKNKKGGRYQNMNSNVWDRIVLSAPVATVQTLSDGNKRGSLTIFLEDQEFKTAALISYMQLAFTADC